MEKPGAVDNPAADLVGEAASLVAAQPAGDPPHGRLGPASSDRQPRAGYDRLERPAEPCDRSTLPREAQVTVLIEQARQRLRTPTQGRRWETEKILRDTAAHLRLIPDGPEKEQLLVEIRSVFAATLAVPDIVQKGDDRFDLPQAYRPGLAGRLTPGRPRDGHWNREGTDSLGARQET